VTDPLASAVIELVRPELKQVVREELRLALDDRLPRWLTVKQVAERIGISESAVRERIRNGLLHANKWQGRWYVEAAEIDRCIADAR
jgi:excisionase family DNA binding protein